MKKLILIIIVLSIGIAGAMLIIPDNKVTAQETDTEEVQLYTCGMHPEIISEEPGYCPLCGMKLTPKKEGASASGTVVIDPTTSHNMGLVTTPARYLKIDKMVRAFGKVKYSEPDVHTVNLKIDGWVEKMYVDYEGMEVFQGQPMIEIYSPKLVAAQREFLVAHKSNDNSNAQFASAASDGNGMNSFLESARQRLSNWDISDDQIEKLVKSGEITRTMKIRAPVGGIVTKKYVNEGQRLQPGTELYKITDLSTVWVTAFVYEQDLPFVYIGQEAIVQFPNIPGETFMAEVSYIAPFLDEKGQAEIRLDVKNRDYLIKPQMYAEIALIAEIPQERLVIPRKAVINSGMREIAYVSEGEGSYSARTINTGVIGRNDMVEVRSGLSAGEQVVTSGQFLIDSESRLHEALSSGGHTGHSHGDMASNDSKNEDDHSTHEMQDSRKTNKDAKTKDGELSGVYTCPMPEHFHVLQFGEGDCPECGMNLVAVEETENTEVYVCPMEECGVVQSEPGRCPVCGMHLMMLEGETEKAAGEKSENMEHDSETHSLEDRGHSEEGEMSEMELSGIYTCPMPEHFDVVQYGEGKCPECGMNLVAIEKTENSEDIYICRMRECGVAQKGPGDCPVCGMHLKLYEPENTDD